MNKVSGKGNSNTDYVVAFAGMILTRGKGTAQAQIAIKEAKTLLGQWGTGSFRSISANIRQHFGKHGSEVGASSVWQYLRKAEAFARRVRRGVQGTPVPGATEGVMRYRLDGKYIDIGPGGKIISFGNQ
jgi:hypothetical protein